MSFKDGFRFGIGFLLAFGLYTLSLSIVQVIFAVLTANVSRGTI